MGDGIVREEDVLNLGTKELRGGSKRVPILPQNTLVVIDVGLFLVVLSTCGERASFQKVEDGPGDLDLTRVGAAVIVDEWIKGSLGAEKSFNAHGSEEL